MIAISGDVIHFVLLVRESCNIALNHGTRHEWLQRKSWAIVVIVIPANSDALEGRSGLVTLKNKLNRVFGRFLHTRPKLVVMQNQNLQSRKLLPVVEQFQSFCLCKSCDVQMQVTYFDATKIYANQICLFRLVSAPSQDARCGEQERFDPNSKVISSCVATITIIL